jgi:hypothetical protein
LVFVLLCLKFQTTCAGSAMIENQARLRHA